MPDLVGQTISKYRIVARLGAGGMGEVYRAHDEALDRDVALKVLPRETMADEMARARLLREARTASSLNHPHIAHIYEVGEDRGHLFIAMELVQGQSLRDRIPPGGMPADTLLTYALQIADALADAHQRGVIHRDLKSTNIMVTPEGRVKVLDFGLAKRVREDTPDHSASDLSLTATGMIVGTPNYLPPEILLGGQADARSDVWSLGVVFYEMAMGRLPFAGGSVPQLADAIVRGTPSRMGDAVPGGMRSIIERCLAKDPADRFQDGAQVKAALEPLGPSGSLKRDGGNRRRRWPVAAVAALVAAVAAAFAVGALRERNAGTAPRIASLAVLPLANLSGDPGQEYFADGMTEELITDLASIKKLKVISRTSVMRFKGSKKTLHDIARELGVEGVVEGSVLRAGNRVRITAQLIHAGSDRHLWARSYERDFGDVLALQGEVARDIAQEIALQLSDQEGGRLAQHRKVNPEAYDLYLKGRYEWAKVSEAGVKKSLEYFEKARALDPEDARYSSGMADAYLLISQMLNAPGANIDKVKEYARQALAADEGSAEAHASMGAALFFGDWNWAEAERHLKRSIELNPGYAQARLIYSAYLGAVGRIDEALAQDKIALQLDPLSLIINWNASGTLFLARRYDESIAQAQRTLLLDPGSSLPLSSMLRVHEQRGEYETILDMLDQFFPSDQKEVGRAFVAKVKAEYAAKGPPGYWRALLEIPVPGETRPTPTGRLAIIYA